MATASICVLRWSTSCLLVLYTRSSKMRRSAKLPFGSLPLCWHLGACKNLHVPCKEGLCCPQPCGSCTQAPLAFVARCSEYLSSQCRTSRLGSLAWGLPPHAQGRTSPVVMILAFLLLLTPGRQVLTEATLCPLYKVSFWVCLYTFSSGRSFPLVFRSFSSIIARNQSQFYVCLWEEPSSSSSYSAMLATPVKSENHWSDLIGLFIGNFQCWCFQSFLLLGSSDFPENIFHFLARKVMVQLPASVRF